MRILDKLESSPINLRNRLKTRGNCKLTDLQVTFLGTGGSIPTPKRSLSAIVIHRRDELLMFDCGECTQRQMIQAGVGFNRKTKIFITHMHGDHILGLPGLLQTMSLLGRNKKLYIYGPQGIKEFVRAINQTVRFSLTFHLQVTEVEAGIVCQGKEYVIHAIESSHMTPSLAYSISEKPRPGRFYIEKAKEFGVPEGPLWSKLQQGFSVTLPNGDFVKPEMVLGRSRPGRKIVYTGDTRVSQKITELSDGADLLIHEATFEDELMERAIEDGHSTPSMAARTAKAAGVTRLVLTHISARYKNTDSLLQQAKQIFPNTELAHDFLKIDIPLSKD